MKATVGLRYSAGQLKSPMTEPRKAYNFLDTQRERERQHNSTQLGESYLSVFAFLKMTSFDKALAKIPIKTHDVDPPSNWRLHMSSPDFGLASDLE